MFEIDKIYTELAFLVKKPDESSKPKYYKIENHLTPDSWETAIENTLVYRANTNFRNACVICGNRISNIENESKEHIILDGLGIKWASLPKGIVCARDNNNCSKSELKFLRLGMMGVFRPFYLNRKKEISFKDNESREIKLINDPSKGFIIQFFGLDNLNIPDNMDSGVFDFKVPHLMPNTLDVSRSIHKIAYLGLLVINPELALSPVFDDVRHFIENPKGNSFRPYTENFIARASPGFFLRYCILGDLLDDETIGSNTLVSHIKLHHCEYLINLVGKHFKQSDKDNYYDKEIKEGMKYPFKFSIRVEGLYKK